MIVDGFEGNQQMYEGGESDENDEEKPLDRDIQGDDALDLPP